MQQFDVLASSMNLTTVNLLRNSARIVSGMTSTTYALADRLRGGGIKLSLCLNPEGKRCVVEK